MRSSLLFKIFQAVLRLILVLTVILSSYKYIVMPIRTAHLSTRCISRDEAKKGRPETAATDNKLGQHIILLPRAMCQSITKKSQ